MQTQEESICAETSYWVLYVDDMLIVCEKSAFSIKDLGPADKGK